jgi:hypothetical protein
MIIRGQVHQVDCAVRRDGSCPAGDFLDALKKGTWNQGDDSLEADEQLDDYSKFLFAIKYWANHGEPEYKDSAKSLADGVWEFRYADKRLTFYDTDGNGGYTAKLPIRDHADADAPGSRYWQIPNFDYQIRLGHPFTKKSQKTTKTDLLTAQVVRDEDLAHDR